MTNMGSLVAQWYRICLQCRRLGFDLWVRKIPLEKEMATQSSIFAWKSCGQRSLTGHSPWGHKRVGHD